jgi:hypothetical protein
MDLSISFSLCAVMDLSIYKKVGGAGPFHQFFVGSDGSFHQFFSVCSDGPFHI